MQAVGQSVRQGAEQCAAWAGNITASGAVPHSPSRMHIATASQRYPSQRPYRGPQTHTARPAGAPAAHVGSQAGHLSLSSLPRRKVSNSCESCWLYPLNWGAKRDRRHCTGATGAGRQISEAAAPLRHRAALSCGLGTIGTDNGPRDQVSMPQAAAKANAPTSRGRHLNRATAPAGQGQTRDSSCFWLSCAAHGTVRAHIN